jgi:hypothetical protein
MPLVKAIIKSCIAEQSRGLLGHIQVFCKMRLTYITRQVKASLILLLSCYLYE